MNRWVVILTAGSGYTQKYPPNLTFFKKKADAIKYLRKEIKAYVNCESQLFYKSVKDFINQHSYDGKTPYRFDTNVGEFWLEQVVVE